MAKKKVSARVVEAIDKKYELILIFQPDLLETATEKKLKVFEKFLTENRGSIDMKDNWGKRKLAYKIGKFSSGTYVVYNLTLPTTFNKELDEYLRIDKDIIRFLQINIKKDYVYKKFEEEDQRPEKEENSVNRGHNSNSHKASSKGDIKANIKDKGKKADAGSLDDKLGEIIGGGDIKI